MRTFTKEQLAEILRKHLLWNKNKKGGAGANLSGADLSEADLSGANLSGANLSGADLSEIRNFSLLQLIGQPQWYNLTDNTIIEMMKWDVVLGPIDLKDKFKYWKKTNDCPFASSGVKRSLHFSENSELYVEEKPELTLWNLLLRILKENNIKFSYKR